MEKNKIKSVPKYKLRNNKYEHGILDIDYPLTSDKLTKKAYKIWGAMFRRVLLRLEYKDCTISDEWHYFSNFLKWFKENYVEGYHLDKDVICKGNRCYCKELCSFIPPEINTLLTNRRNHRNLLIGTTKTKHGTYQSQLSMYGKLTHLGTFKTPEEAFFVYKTAKESYIKKVALEYYNAGQISKQVYGALINYKVEITD